MPGSVVLKQVRRALCAIISYYEKGIYIIIAVEEDSLQVETDAGHSWQWQTSCTDLQTAPDNIEMGFLFLLLLLLLVPFSRLPENTQNKVLKANQMKATNTHDDMWLS